MSRMRWVVGIDEVGRGPLAGPVMVCALAHPAGYDLRREGKKAGLSPLKDSKKLSIKQREEWAEWLKDNRKLRFAFAGASPATIDKLNISTAANGCAWRAFGRVSGFGYRVSGGRGGRGGRGAQIYLDGGLFIKDKQFQEQFNAKTLPKADEKIAAVSAASILAKVQRDELMAGLDGKYPGYGFAQNAGYGTSAHLRALRKLGMSKAHRLTFCRGIRII